MKRLIFATTVLVFGLVTGCSQQQINNNVSEEPVAEQKVSASEDVSEEVQSDSTVNGGLDAESTEVKTDLHTYAIKKIADNSDKGFYWSVDIQKDTQILQTVKIEISEFASAYPEASELITEEDVNFDGVKDLLFLEGHYGTQCALGYVCYISNEDGSQYTFCPSFSEILNYSIMEEEKMISGTNRDSAASYSVYYYQYTDNAFQLVKEEHYEYDEDKEEFVLTSDTGKGASYGVFLSIDNSEIAKLSGYDTVVIDAQYFEQSDIAKLHKNGQEVYSYINFGSIENFREYYAEYKELFLGEYENWEEEQWVDTSSSKWQNFIVKEIANSMVNKGVDGFFVDNCDVYYNFKEEKIYQGLDSMLSELMKYDKDVIINSGDTYLDEHFSRNSKVQDVITGINQETVFSSINFDNGTFGKQTKEDSEYYRSYIEKYSQYGATVYLLEYTTDPLLVETIKEYCDSQGFNCYISDSVELD